MPVASAAALLDPGIPPGWPDADALKETERSLVIIDSRALDREFFARGIAAHRPTTKVLAVGSLEEWRRVKDQYPPLAAILLNVGGRNVGEDAVADEIRKLVSGFKNVPVIILADTDDLAQIRKALECGARGYTLHRRIRVLRE